MATENGGTGGGRTVRGSYKPDEDGRPFVKGDHHVGWDRSMENALENEEISSLYGRPLRMRRWVVIKENPGSVGDYITELSDEG